MSKLLEVHNWRAAYLALRSTGMTDKAIADTAGVSRATINNVCNNGGADGHSPDFNGGLRVLTKLKELKQSGQLPDFKFDSLGARPGDAQRPAGNAAGEGLGGAAGLNGSEGAAAQLGTGG